jgi:peroxiredoxin
MSMRRLFFLPALLLAVSLPSVAATPGVGQRAPDFTLTALDGTSVSLSSYMSHGRVVLILLRGYPGYQCPFSQQQFQSYQEAAAQFAALGVQIIFIYPGASSKSLADDAAQIVGNQPLPANMHLVLDPDYVVTNQYGLRWDDPNQTVYPSTFLIARKGTIFFAHTGRSSSDVTPPSDALVVLNANTDAVKN